MKFLKDKTYQELQERLKNLEADNKFLKQKTIDIDGRGAVVTPGASSSRDLPPNQTLSVIQNSLKVVTPDFQFDVIPIIRKLSIVNEGVNQAVNDLTRLANTGHKIKFNPEVSADQIDAMRQFIVDSSKHWHAGCPGASAVVSKMFRQIFIGGAISNEWIPNLALNDLEELRFLKPESIRFVIEKNSRGYQPYQQLKHKAIDLAREYKKLNVNQFRYIALNGDTDLPYGIPPFIPALDPIATQRMMMDNIKFVVEYLGVMGYLDAKMAKPNRNANESDEAYITRLQNILGAFKDRVLKGQRDGINVGYIDDHEFEFHATAKDAKGVTDLWDLNEQRVSSGLNYDSIFRGMPGATETLVTIMFTKMLAQLKNVQDLVKENLEFGYRLVLTLAGFNFKNLTVEFNRSTITDELKYQQAQEILIRNLVVKYQYGLISLESFADELGYLAPDQKEPRIDINQDDPIGDSKKREAREKDKDKSDKTSRSKKKPQGTTRRQNRNDEPSTSLKHDREAKIIRIG